MSSPVSTPTRSISSNGPIRNPPPSRQMRSTCSIVAIRSETRRRPSRPNGRLQRLTRKPTPSTASITCLPIASPAARASAIASGEDSTPDDDLQQRHHRRRVEEVHADDALGVRQRRRDRGHEQRRGVGRQHAAVRHVARDLGEQLALELKRLGRGLDHELALGQAGRLAHRLEVGGRPACACSSVSRPRSAPRRSCGGDPLGAARERLRIGVVQQRPRARLASELSDAGAHRAGARDADRPVAWPRSRARDATRAPPPHRAALRAASAAAGQRAHRWQRHGDRDRGRDAGHVLRVAQHLHAELLGARGSERPADRVVRRPIERGAPDDVPVAVLAQSLQIHGSRPACRVKHCR